MLLKRVKTEWSYISKPNQQGKYTVTIRPDAKQQAEIEDLLQKTWEDEFGSKKSPAWFGGKKDDENGIKFVANRNAKYIDKQGKEVENTLQVFDIRANELKDVPNVANGATMNLSLNAYITEYQGKKGVSLGLQKVQLIEYSLYSGSGDEFECEEEDDDSEDNFRPESTNKPTGL